MTYWTKDDRSSISGRGACNWLGRECQLCSFSWLEFFFTSIFFLFVVNCVLAHQNRDPHRPKPRLLGQINVAVQATLFLTIAIRYPKFHSDAGHINRP